MTTATTTTTTATMPELRRSSEPVVDQLRGAVSAYNARWTAQRMAEDAIRRVALLNAASRKLIKEERKASKSRAETSALLNESATQVIRGLVQTVQRLEKENGTLIAREKRRICACRNAQDVLQAMAAHLDDHQAHEPFCWGDTILNMAQTNTNASALGADLDEGDTLALLDKAVARLQSAVQQAIAVRSSAYNPERQIQDLSDINQARHDQLKRSNVELAVLDERVRELRHQVALGVEQRSHALEEATSKAYVRSFQQHQAEVRRLQVARDALVVELGRLQQRVVHLEGKRALPKRIAPLHSIAPAC